MRQRCKNINNYAYNRYGGRGITVCKRWEVFDNFLYDMGFSPSENHSLDRVNNDLGYSKENCRWATKKEQSNNRRNNIIIFFLGEKKSLKEWSKHFNLPYKLTHKRYKNGWSLERVFAHKRHIKTIELNGETKTIGEWCEIYNTNFTLVHKRIDRGWDINKAFTVRSQREKTIKI